MAITQAFVTAAKVALLDGEIDFSADTAKVYRIALFTSAAVLDATTTAYTTTGETTGTGYTAGGMVLVVAANPQASGTTAIMDFDDAIWPSATLTARGAMIYEDNGGTNPAVAILDFGADIASTNGNFEVQFPTFNVTEAIIRIG